MRCKLAYEGILNFIHRKIENTRILCTNSRRMLCGKIGVVAGNKEDTGVQNRVRITKRYRTDNKMVSKTWTELSEQGLDLTRLLEFCSEIIRRGVDTGISLVNVRGVLAKEVWVNSIKTESTD